MPISLLSNPLALLAYAIALVIAITIHEFAHAYVADQLGDPTPRLQGRVSLNPIVHMDLTGLLFLLFIGFGWGKPVVFDPFNLKNPRRDAALISIAGPLSNLLVAFVASIPLRFMGEAAGSGALIVSFFLINIIQLNIMLAIFNLLPIHPLDGFKIVGGLLPRSQAHDWYSLERYGLIFLILLLIPFGGQTMLGMIIGPIISLLTNLFIPGSVFPGSL